MEDRVCLVTGANSGIGYEIAMGLARRKATVIIICRNREKGEEARATFIAGSNNPRVELFCCDLSSQGQIRELAENLKKSYNNVHVLVNNAGGLNIRRMVTVDGIEYTFAVNYLAYFLLTNLLLDMLIRSTPSRVVNVTSHAHRDGKIWFDDLQQEKKYSGFVAYNQSKLAVVLFTYELARRLEGKGVTVNCAHPGIIATNIWNKNPGRLGGMLNRLAPLIKWMMHKPAKGAETPLYLAVSPEVEGVTGKYFMNKIATPSSPLSYDTKIAKRLWLVSEQLTGLIQTH
jgi:NAD(P)-dependent dehydrogenase (short-subunit alcohol dehydrogenase family)